MARDGLDQTAAFDRLRRAARSSRRRIGHVADELLRSGRLPGE
jgi:AmiR/NasT family two-component response regulator